MSTLVSAAEAAAPISPADTFAGQLLELSIVMPCLNEADTLAVCIRKAQETLREHGIAGEVIVADNGSDDGSVELATRLGARVVHVPERGYGAALMGGIRAARGAYVLMGDADDSYDFRQAPKFLALLRQGYDLLKGCRLPGGGGTILPGAMPWLHRWIGNPLFSRLVRLMFDAPIHDVYCGLRGFRRQLCEELDLRAIGMEFATEMIIKCSLFGKSIAETCITLHPDGRRSHAPHLRTFRDGWRTLTFFLMYSPKWLFMIPGILLVLLGLIGAGLALPGFTVFGATLDAHTLLCSSLAVLLGFQLMTFAAFTKAFGVRQGFLPAGRFYRCWSRRINLERGICLGLAAFLGGIGLLGAAVWQWRAVDFGPLDYAHTMRWVIPGVTSTVLGFQTIAASFLISILSMGRNT
jgi:glycosyltransferase involved in cell wall biosynthesis